VRFLHHAAPHLHARARLRPATSAREAAESVIAFRTCARPACVRGRALGPRAFGFSAKLATDTRKRGVWSGVFLCAHVCLSHLRTCVEAVLLFAFSEVQVVAEA